MLGYEYVGGGPSVLLPKLVHPYLPSLWYAGQGVFWWLTWPMFRILRLAGTSECNGSTTALYPKPRDLHALPQQNNDYHYRESTYLANRPASRSKYDFSTAAVWGFK